MGDRRREGAIPLSSVARRELDELVRTSYPELRAVAARALRDERAATLKPTALVHEVYLRLAQLSRIEWQGTAHLLAMAARVAREALVDEARRRGRKKRDGGTRVTLTLEGLNAPATDHDVLDVDDLLRELETIDQTAARVVELRVFGGLSVEECAVELETSASTVNRKWRAGRTWLVRELAA
jgi:RNA polymerase sigma factor (TIGR02999 family)